MKTKKDFIYAAYRAWETLQEMGRSTHAARSKITIPLDNGCTVQFTWIAPREKDNSQAQCRKPLPNNI